MADTIKNDVYYQCVQQYFIEHKELFDKLDQKTINIHIPVSQNLSVDDTLLQNWARVTFIDGPGKNLKLHINQN